MHVCDVVWLQLQVLMSTGDAGQITSVLLGNLESSCATRSNVGYHGWTIPRATATQRLRATLTGNPHRAPVADLLLTDLLSGTVKVKASVSHLTRTGVHFADGTCIDHVDAVICATGHLRCYLHSLSGSCIGGGSYRTGPAHF